MHSSDRVISAKELARIIPYSKVHIWRLERAGLFPRRLRLGPNRVGWLKSEIDAWLSAKSADRDAAHPSPSRLRLGEGGRDA